MYGFIFSFVNILNIVEQINDGLLGLHMSNQFFVMCFTQRNLVGGSALHVER